MIGAPGEVISAPSAAGPESGSIWQPSVAMQEVIVRHWADRSDHGCRAAVMIFLMKQQSQIQIDRLQLATADVCIALK